jgi:predicted nucleic acid-binding protein
VYVLDSNVYIEALRSAAFGAVLGAWEQRMLPWLWLSSVVVFEVVLGAQGPREVAHYERRLLEPFHRRGRVLEPGLPAWRMTASAIRKLASQRRYADKLRQRRFLCDLLIATSCRSVGATLITANASDFALIKKVTGCRFRTSLPA